MKSEEKILDEEKFHRNKSLRAFYLESLVMLTLIYEIFVKTPRRFDETRKRCSIYDGIVTEVLRNGGTDADSQCSKMDRSGSRDTGWRRYRRIYIKRYYIYRSKIRTDQRSKTVCYSTELSLKTLCLRVVTPLAL